MTQLQQAEHPELADGRWQTLPLLEQLANVGSEVERTMNWSAKGRADYGAKAFGRALELLHLTIADPKNRLRLRELTRLREALLDYFEGENSFGSTRASWHSYFHAYGMAVALQRQVRSAP